MDGTRKADDWYFERLMIAVLTGPNDVAGGQSASGKRLIHIFKV